MCIVIIIIIINNNYYYNNTVSIGCYVQRQCCSVLEQISSVLLCPVLDSATPWKGGREQLMDELGEWLKKNDLYF